MIRDANGFPIQVGELSPNCSTLALSMSSNPTSQLKTNCIYRLWSSVDCFVKLGASSVTCTTSDSPLTAKVPEYFKTGEANLYLAGIVSSGTGTLFITEVYG